MTRAPFSGSTASQQSRKHRRIQPEITEAGRGAAWRTSIVGSIGKNHLVTPSSNLSTSDAYRPKVAEFFAGVGLVRLGLEQAGFDVTWSNDYAPFKRDLYMGHFAETPDHTFVLDSVENVTGADVPDIDLAWASFPCTDLSLAGGRSGLAGTSSGTFYEFTRVLREMGERRPRVVALENVLGLATSHGGDDMIAAIRELNDLGYSVDVMAIDARRFVAQSRPRLFIVGCLTPPEDGQSDASLRPDTLQGFYAVPGLRMHRGPSPQLPGLKASGFGDLVEHMPENDSRWWDAERTKSFISSLSPIQMNRVLSLQNASSITYRTAYRRTRNGRPVWEVRPDDIAGCLRTARGGSSKQAVAKMGNGSISLRWMTGREYARLMGADDYVIDGVRESSVMFGFGDAVCAPVIHWLGDGYLSNALRNTSTNRDVESLVVKRAS